MAIDQGALDWAKYHPGEGDRPAGYHGEGGGSSSGGFSYSGPSLDEFNRQQEAKTNDLLGRYKTAVSNQEGLGAMAERIGGSLGLPTLRTNAQNLTQAVEDIPQVQGQATRGYDVNQNQLDRIKNAQYQKLSPLAEKAVNQQQTGEQLLAQRLGYETQQQQKELQPFQMEADLLNSNLGREMTGYTQDKQNQLQTYLQQLQNGQQLSLAQMQQANQLAMEEQQHVNRLKEMKFGTDEAIRQHKAILQNPGLSFFNDPTVMGILNGGSASGGVQYSNPANDQFAGSPYVDTGYNVGF